MVTLIFDLLMLLSPCRSEIENLVGAKSPPGSEQGKLTLSNGLQLVKCLNVSGTFIGRTSGLWFLF